MGKVKGRDGRGACPETEGVRQEALSARYALEKVGLGHSSHKIFMEIYVIEGNLSNWG